MTRPASTLAPGTVDNGPATSAKLPTATLAFWIMTIAAMALGDTAGTMFAQTLKLGHLWTATWLFAIFVMMLVGQLLSRSYNPFCYWTVILSTGMAATAISTFMTRTGPVGVAVLSSLLVGIVIRWKLTGLPSEINDGTTVRGEILFWTAILVSTTLGAALGEFLSDSSGLSHAGSAVLTAGSLCVLLALARVWTVPNVFVFWSAIVLTTSLGATAGDLLAEPAAAGGLGLGTVGASAVFLILLFGPLAHVRRRSPASHLTAT